MDGKCECGCGQPTAKAPYTSAKRGWVKGVTPMRYISGHNAPRRPFEPLEARYQVEDRGYATPCWVWKRTRSRKGYARMWDPVRRRVVQASRFFYESSCGGPIPDDLQIDHLCRVRACVNPAHLEVVTQYVNQQRGANAKLTREQADEIRDRGTDESVSRLSREFGVSKTVVAGIVRGHLWL